MGWRNDQCKKVCRIIDIFLANRPTERDSLIVAVRKAFDALEQADTNCSEIPNNWIPCSERLPKESRKYLVTVFDGIGKRTTSAPYHRRSKSWTLTGRMAYWKVVAWKPLPEPYQEGGEADE